MARKYPPKNYTQQQYPLPHNFSYDFGLGCEDETKNSMLMTLIRQTESAQGVDEIEVNPRNAAFLEETGPSIAQGSIVPKINFSFQAFIPKTAGYGTDTSVKIPKLILNYMPIYTSFLDSLTAEDSLSTDNIEEILELQHTTATKDVEPLHTGTDLFSSATSGNGSHPLNTVHMSETFASYSLTTDAKLESVAFSKENLYNALHYYTNKGMLSKVIGPMKSAYVSFDRPFGYHSNNFTNPSVKRGNDYTFCGMLFHLEQAGSTQQPLLASEVTNIEHLHISAKIRFDEWNPNFVQVAI